MIPVLMHVHVFLFHATLNHVVKRPDLLFMIKMQF